MARLDDSVKCLALALLNLSDDEGFFLADAALVRSFARPIDEDSSITRRCLDQLVSVGWVVIRTHATHGSVGCVVNFHDHQSIDRPKPSRIRVYFDSTESQNDRRCNNDASSLEQGTGNREQVSPPNPPAAAGGKERRPRRVKADDLLDAGEVHPDSVKWGRAMVDGWRKADPDGRPIGCRLTETITRMDAIAKRQPLFTPEIQYRGGMAYCREARQRYKASQYFLSLEPDPQTQKPPFHPFVSAEVNARNRTPHSPATGSVKALEGAHV